MSNKGKYWDNAPFIPYSGVTTALEGVSADNSIRQDLYFTPSTVTPDEIKKYRDSTRQRVGVKQLHYGIYDDPKDYEDLVHGVPTKSSLHVDDCIKGTNLSGNQIFMNQLKEDKFYASHKREPLGAGLQRDYIFPDQCSNPDFKFIQHDICEPIDVPCDKIFHLACPASPPAYQAEPIKTILTCINGTYNMLTLAEKYKAKILFTSTSEVYGDPEVHPQKEDYRGYVNCFGPRSCYDEGKRLAESLCFEFQRKGVYVRIARLFNTYGPFMQVKYLYLF